MGLFSSIGRIFKAAAPAALSFIPGAGPALSAAASGFLSSEGVRDANQANIASGREAANFNMVEAQKNRDFNSAEAVKQRTFNSRQARTAYMRSAHLSNTAHFREVRDLRRAGLNPILSSKYGGSSTPPVASASSVAASAGSPATRQPVRSQDSATPGITSALAVQRMAQEINNMRAQEALTREQTNTEKNKQEELTTRGQGHATRAGLDYANTQLVETQERKMEAEISQLKANTRRTAADTARIKTETRNIAARLQGLLNEQEIDQTEYGKAMAYLNRAVPLATSVGGLIRSFWGMLPAKIANKVSTTTKSSGEWSHTVTKGTK